MKWSGWIIMFVLVSTDLLQSQHAPASLRTPIAASLGPSLDSAHLRKIGSALLLQHAERKKNFASIQGVQPDNSPQSIVVAIYASHDPLIAELAEFDRLGVRCVQGSWIPPLENHPLGFFIAKVPVDKIADVLSLSSVVKMDSAESESLPMNNAAALSVKATVAWANGWTGSGVKVAVIDSGLDYLLPKTELPDSMWYRNYAFYPDLIDTNIRNTATGHGTHVTGIVCAKGGYSASPLMNTGNGSSPYKGMAPDAQLVFLKIGQIRSSGATEAAMIAALKSAADTFHVRVANMSYGAWDTYHDGSGALSQAADYAFSKNVACFFAAGNDGAAARHYSGTIAAQETTGFIQVNTVSTGSTVLEFNLVWADGGARRDLGLLFYNSAFELLNDMVHYSTTQSPRGTESKYSMYNRYLPAGSAAYYLRVRNLSASSQSYHIYEAWNSGGVKFASPDPNYTISSPALADHAFAVGAYTTRTAWIGVTGEEVKTGYALNDIAPFSSQGPRIDGLQKPNICAPGSAVISLRDRDVLTTANSSWIDNDGVNGGDANYYVMQGTSMASPVAAGCAALLVQHTPSATPQQIYDAISLTASADDYTGAVPNSTWGAGKIDVNTAINDPALPVELASFTSHMQKGSVVLAWRTATETNNYGFEIERKRVFEYVPSSGSPEIRPDAWMKIGFLPGHGTSHSPNDYAFTDCFPGSGRTCYRLRQIDRDGRFEYSRVLEITADALLPIADELWQNYPNPFNPSTTIRFSIAEDCLVRLTVFDVLGRQMAELVNGRLELGLYTTRWDAYSASSGVYFYRIEAGRFSAVRKLLLKK
ncbi:MAG TPA: S8 family peptidase [Bacteroidota bacterium]|nr:S8 family peptidase [Bacteroidota bacterium]